ncbi:MAG: HAMP domain-containing protein, partial [Rubrivivax sp.]|nr:HAMP domain-containing protein [Pyrinomonadaceae bacterium]
MRGATDRFADVMSSVREWMRRAMPRVALASVALYILWLLIRGTEVYKSTPISLVGPLALFAFCATVLYYGLKILVRLKRMLLWRVRRRLIITYLFVGATPVVLLLLLGALAAAGGSSQAMVRVVTVEVGATERQALDAARALADALIAFPPGADERAAQNWLDERAMLLRATLPGARVSAWRGTNSEHALSLGEAAPSQLVSMKVVDEQTRGVGFDTGDARDTLPAWLGGREEWSGLAFLPPPEGTKSAHGTPSVRALVRRVSQGRAVALLVTVPVSRALVQRYRENTGVNVRPFFLGISDMTKGGEGRVVHDLDDTKGEGEREPRTARFELDGRETVVDFRRDQFGEPMPDFSFATLNFPCPVFLEATDWLTGGRRPHWALVLDWSWAEGGKQFWNNAVLGETLWTLLYVIAVAFLVLELLALVSAAWMTRAVTGTVHKLYRATGFINRGDFSHRIRTRSRDQLGELTVAFNDMSANIETLLAERVVHER